MEPADTALKHKLIPNPKARLQEQVREVVRMLQDLLGHRNVATTRIYTHVMQRPGLGVRSPLDN